MAPSIIGSPSEDMPNPALCTRSYDHLTSSTWERNFTVPSSSRSRSRTPIIRRRVITWWTVISNMRGSKVEVLGRESTASPNGRVSKLSFPCWISCITATAVMGFDTLQMRNFNCEHPVEASKCRPQSER